MKSVEWEQIGPEVCLKTETKVQGSGYDLGSSKTLTYSWRCFPCSTPPTSCLRRQQSLGGEGWDLTRSWVKI